MRLCIISLRMRGNTPYAKSSVVFHAWIRRIGATERIDTFQVDFNRLRTFLRRNPQHNPETKAHCSPSAALKNVPLPSPSSIELASSRELVASLSQHRRRRRRVCAAKQASSVSPRHFPIALLYSSLHVRLLIGSHKITFRSRKAVGKCSVCVPHVAHNHTYTLRKKPAVTQQNHFRMQFTSG